MQVLRGGPVETKRGFVLHSADFFLESATLPIDDGICLTATLDILRAIAIGSGPENAVLALGYAGWAAGQLEAEIQSNGWLHCAADPALLFDEGIDTKYNRALARSASTRPSCRARRGTPESLSSWREKVSAKQTERAVRALRALILGSRGFPAFRSAFAATLSGSMTRCPGGIQAASLEVALAPISRRASAALIGWPKT